MNRFQAKYELDEERLFRRLHIDGDSFSDECARDSVPGLREIAEKNMDLNVWYLEGSHDFETEIEEVDACKKQVICLVYTSQKILDIVDSMSANGDFLESYILNDMANDILFNASNQLNRYLTESFRDNGEYLTRKYFPGEGGISLRLQKLFLDLMKERQELNIDINSSYMLIPEKAMMYAFGVDPDNEELSWEHDCSQCDREDCFFRDRGQKDSFCPR